MSDADDADVVEVKAANAILPNLTICVEKEEDQNGDAPVEFIEEDETMAEEKPKQNESVEIKVKSKSFTHTKIYENKALKDMGMTPEEARLKKENRAKRFRSPLVRDEVDAEDEKEKIDPKLIQDMIRKVTEFNKTCDEGEKVRLEAVHMRGLDDMSTEDIFSFFSDFFPSHIEWVNDTSCNVVWNDVTSASNAILSMTEPNSLKTDDEMTKVEVKKKEDDSLDLMESDEEMEVEDSKNPGENQKEEDSKAQDVEFKNELRRCKKSFSKGDKKTLLRLRLAKMDDKKVLGGAKKSNYYKKYGNPNYGNVKGILSRSFMKRYHGRVAKREFESFKPIPKEIEGNGVKGRLGVRDAPSKRMYSDTEQFKAKKQKLDDDSTDESEDSEEEERNVQEREDNELINSSAKDLLDAVPTGEGEEEESYDTMMADRISQKIDAARRSQASAQHSGNMNVTVDSGNVWARLGKKPESDGMKFTVKNERTEQKPAMERIKNRLPESLRNRLGNKRR